MPDEQHPDETPFSSDSDSANDATKAEAIEEAQASHEDRKPAGALKFLTVVMFLLIVGLIAGPFLWGLADRKGIAPDPSVLNPWLEWLGDLHVVILHVPIGIFVLIFLMEIFGLLSFRKFKPHLGGALALNSVFAMIAAVFGYFLFLEGDHGNAPLTWSWEDNLMGMHMWLSITFTVLVILSFISKMWSRHHNRFSPFYPIFMLLAATSLTISAHMGGQLVHKDKDIVGDFLVLSKGGTPGVAEEDIVKVMDVTDIPAEDRLVYAEIVKPILQGKCWECHAVAELNPLGKKKIKGGLEMTTVELLLKGGKNADVAPTLVPGDVNLSEMLTRVHLDVDDDEFMPKGKEDEPEAHLTEGEIRILEWWIASGSIEGGVIDEANDIPLKEAEGYESILSDVAAFQPVLPPKVKETDEKEEKKVEEELPVEKEEKVEVTEVTREQLTELKKKIDGKFPNSLTFASADSDEMHFSAVTYGKEFDNSSLKNLEPVADAVVKLDLKKTSVTDEGMDTVSKFTNLRRLMLNETGVSDDGVKMLSKLPALESLSLFDTQVSDEGVLALKETKTLKAVYLSRTGASQKAIDELKAALPAANIVYQPTLIEPVMPLEVKPEPKPFLPEDDKEPEVEKPALLAPKPPLPKKPATVKPAPIPIPEKKVAPVVPPKPKDAELEQTPLEVLPPKKEKIEEPAKPEPKKTAEKTEEKSAEKPAPKPAKTEEKVTPPEKEDAKPPQKKEAVSQPLEVPARELAPTPEKVTPKPALVPEKKEQKPAPAKDSTEEAEPKAEPKKTQETAPKKEVKPPVKEEPKKPSSEEDEISQRAREAIEKLRKAAEGE